MDRAALMRRYRCGGLAAVWLSLLACGGGVACADSYRLGHGYQVPGLGLDAGGYLSVQGSRSQNQPNRLSLQDLSLFLHEDFSPDWHFFTEIELGQPIVATPTGVSTAQTDFDIERFYVDYNLSTRATLRFGKFLTPIGRWNQIHADPLVWTVTRPLSTETAFAKNASGAQLYGSWPLAHSAIDYQLYVDDTDVSDPTDAHESIFSDARIQPNPPDAFTQAVGARIKYRALDDALQIGLSAAHFQMKDQPGFKNLVGADFFYTAHRVEFQSEMLYRRDESAPHQAEWGGYGQIVVPLVRNFYGVFAHERYQSELFPQPVNSNVWDITYRPIPPFSIKLERRQSSGEKRLAPSGWVVSMALLF